MSEFKKVITQIAVCPSTDKDPLLSELSTFITLYDEGAGAYAILSQHADAGAKIRLAKNEIEYVMRAAISLISGYE